MATSAAAQVNSLLCLICLPCVALLQGQGAGCRGVVVAHFWATWFIPLIFFMNVQYPFQKSKHLRKRDISQNF